MCELLGEIEIGFTEEEGSRLDSPHFTEMGRTSYSLFSGWEGRGALPEERFRIELSNFLQRGLMMLKKRIWSEVDQGTIAGLIILLLPSRLSPYTPIYPYYYKLLATKN